VVGLLGEQSSADKLLRFVLPLYVAASLLHFSHNAEFLSDYPNLPSWISRANIYVIWLGLTTMGCMGFWMYRQRRVRTGLLVLGLYATLGFGGLLHYSRAPFSAHTLSMNVTILLEASIAALLLAVVLVIGCRRGKIENGRSEPTNY
jgi:hypothetical protein